MLAWTIYLSFLGVFWLMLLRSDDAKNARKVALFISVTGLLIALAGVAGYDGKGGLTDVVDAAWLPGLGIRFHLAADGISLVLVLLTGIAAVVGVLFSWNIEHRAKELFAPASTNAAIRPMSTIALPTKE